MSRVGMIKKNPCAWITHSGGNQLPVVRTLTQPTNSPTWGVTEVSCQKSAPCECTILEVNPLVPSKPSDDCSTGWHLERPQDRTTQPGHHHVSDPQSLFTGTHKFLRERYWQNTASLVKMFTDSTKWKEAFGPLNSIEWNQTEKTHHPAKTIPDSWLTEMCEMMQKLFVLSF